MVLASAQGSGRLFHNETDLPDTLRLVHAQLKNFVSGSMRGYVLMQGRLD